jgi:hypothetical protein
MNNLTEGPPLSSTGRRLHDLTPSQIKASGQSAVEDPM